MPEVFSECSGFYPGFYLYVPVFFKKGCVFYAKIPVFFVKKGVIFTPKNTGKGVILKVVFNHVYPDIKRVPPPGK